MKKALTIIAFAALLCSCGPRSSKDLPEEVQQDTIKPLLGFWPEDYTLEESTVKSGDTFSNIMTRMGMTSESAYRLYQECDSLFDVKTLRAGNGISAYYADSLLQYVVYNNDKIHRTIFKCTEPLSVWKATKPVDYEQKYADVSIETSLWNDMLAAGSDPEIILKLSDIYAWTVDFFGLQKDDRFRVLYGETRCEGELISVDTVYYSVFSREDKEVQAIMLDTGDGGNIYWNEKGESLRKAFLKAPLKFNRISSGFSYHRKHPVTGQVKAHTGVDYAAPTGTPVMSIGDGTVTGIGYEGAGGNTVRIRHNSVYSTAYLHLSRYAKGLKVGQRVSQGEVIGYVGMTGTATGPHLDFRVWMNGSPINPLTMESPSVEPLPEEYMPALDSALQVYRTIIDGM